MAQGAGNVPVQHVGMQIAPFAGANGCEKIHEVFALAAATEGFGFLAIGAEHFYLVVFAGGNDRSVFTLHNDANLGAAILVHRAGPHARVFPRSSRARHTARFENNWRAWIVM